MISKIFKSTNGTLNIVLLVLLAIAASLSFPEQPLENLFVAIVAFAATVREWLKNGVKFTWNTNVFAYLMSAALMIFPFLDELLPALESFINAVIEGKTEKILAAVFLVLNVVWKLFQSKPWKNQPATT